MKAVATVDGWNISKGRRVRLHLFERANASLYSVDCGGPAAMAPLPEKIPDALAAFRQSLVTRAEFLWVSEMYPGDEPFFFGMSLEPETNSETDEPSTDMVLMSPPVRRPH